jgi:hypothetical protein
MVSSMSSILLSAAQRNGLRAAPALALGGLLLRLART